MPLGISRAEGEADFALVVFDAADDDLGVFVLQDAGKLLAPLDEENVALLQHQVFQTERVHFAGLIEAVKIDVEDIFVWSVVLVDESEGGTGNIIGLGGTEAFCNALHKRGFACAKVAAQQYHASVLELRRELTAKLYGLFGRVRSEIARHCPHDSIAGGDSKEDVELVCAFAPVSYICQLRQLWDTLGM